MRCGIIQPNYFPWRGYLDFIAGCDLFILLDDVQYTGRDWRNRCLIASGNSTAWMTVPIQRHPRQARICDVIPKDPAEWIQHHVGQISAACRTAPFRREAVSLLAECANSTAMSLVDLDERALGLVANYLEIETPTVRSSSLGVKGSRSEKLLGILQEVGASTYVTGPSALGYLDVQWFHAEGIEVLVKTYEYDTYWRGTNPFHEGLSILDTIAWLGPGTRQAMKSRAPYVKVPCTEDS